MTMDAAALVRILLELGTHEERAWVARPYRRSDAVVLEGVVDVGRDAAQDLSWVVWLDEERPILGIGDTRLHWGGMSVPIDPDPFRAIAQLVAAVDAVRPHGPDSRPTVSPRG